MARRPTGALDGFRAYAILGIVFIHLLLLAGVLAGREEGVGALLVWALLGNLIDVFFIASGFLLFLPLVDRGGRPASWRNWVAGRFARLLPAYWLCLTVVLALVLVSPPSGVDSPPPAEIAVQYAALQMPVRLFDPGMPVGFGVDGPLWMISVIAGFYLVLPIVARLYLRRPLVGLAVAAAVTIGWKLLVTRTGLFEALSDGSAPDWVVSLIAIDQLPAWALSFGLGMTGAWAYRQIGSRWSAEGVSRAALWAVVPIGLAYAGFSAAYGEAGLDLSGPVTGSVARSEVLVSVGSTLSRAALMAAILVGPLALRRPFEGRLVSRMAELSYGLYLIHFVVLVYAARALPDTDLASPPGFLLLTAVVLSLSLLYAYASRRWVEEPARKGARARLAS